MGEKWIIDRNHPFDSVTRSNVKKEEFILNIHETFIEYLNDCVTDNKELKIILKSLASQQLEKIAMQVDKKNPFYGKEAAFEQYCKIKYKELYDHIIRMIDRLVSSRL